MLKFDEEGIRTRINDVLIGSMDEIPLVTSNFDILSTVEKAFPTDRPIFIYDIYDGKNKWRYKVSVIAFLFIRVSVLLDDGIETKYLFSMDYLIYNKDKNFSFVGIRDLVYNIPYVTTFYTKYKNDKDVIEYVHSVERLIGKEIKDIFNTNKEIVKDKSKLGYYYITEQAKLALRVFNGVISLYESTR